MVFRFSVFVGLEIPINLSDLELEHTMQKLFSAQSTKTPTQNQNQHSSVPPTSYSSSHAHAQTAPPPKVRQNFFTSFFTSSKPQNKQTAKQLPVMEETSIPTCEDCERPLQERELYLSGEGRCINCKRRVCFDGGCSVTVNDGWGGEGRVCLGCALR